MPTIRDRCLGTVPKYRRHRPSGQAVVTLAGRDHYLGPFGAATSKTEYNRLVGEWLAAGRPSSAVESQRAEITVVEVIARYWAFAQGYYRKHGEPTRTLDNIKRAVAPVKRLYGDQPAESFGPLALKSIQRLMIEQPDRGYADGRQRTRPRTSRKYINGAVDIIKRMFRWAASEELVPVAVYQALATVSGLRMGRTAARESPPVLPVADGVIEATLPYLPSVVADMVRFQRLTGCRPSEVCSLRPCDVDRTGPTWRYVPATHKTEHHGRQRVIFIGPKAAAILAPYLLRAADACCFCPAESEEKRREEMHTRRRTPLSCGSKPGSNRRKTPKRKPQDRYFKDAYARAVTRAAKKAGVAPWSPNRLRHTAATEVRKLYGLEGAQVALGHARADVTQVYAERDQSLAERIAREVG
jgi:integrase